MVKHFDSNSRQEMILVKFRINFRFFCGPVFQGEWGHFSYSDSGIFDRNPVFFVIQAWPGSIFTLQYLHYARQS